MHTVPKLHVLTRSDLSDLVISPLEVISAVEDGYIAYATGRSACPTKLMLPLPDKSRDAVSYSMLGYDANIEQLAFKTSYRQGSESAEKYYTTITLYDDVTGMPFALMDCQRIGALRTPATTALIARECAHPEARTALMVGTGVQGRHTLPFLAATLPRLEHLKLFGTHPDGIAESIATLEKYCPGRSVELVDDVPSAVAKSDIVVAASGRAAHPKIDLAWMKPGGLLISVASKGVKEATLEIADYAIATNIGQLGVTGRRMAGASGEPHIDAELPEILVGNATGRRDPNQRVFAFSSGMIITDIPVAHALATQAIAAGRGNEVTLWS